MVNKFNFVWVGVCQFFWGVKIEKLFCFLLMARGLASTLEVAELEGRRTQPTLSSYHYYQQVQLFTCAFISMDNRNVNCSSWLLLLFSGHLGFPCRKGCCSSAGQENKHECFASCIWFGGRKRPLTSSKCIKIQPYQGYFSLSEENQCLNKWDSGLLISRPLEICF